MCSSQLDDRNKLIEHYITYHNIDQDNYFFKCLIQNIQNKPYLKNVFTVTNLLQLKKKKYNMIFSSIMM